MPTLLFWPLLVPPPLPPILPPPLPIFPPTSGPGPGGCDGVMHSQGYFLSLFDRVLAPSYLQPLKSYPASGYEYFQSVALTFARVSQAIERLECGSIAMFAAGGSFATGVVQFYRPTADAGAVVIRAGSVVTCSRSGRDFVTTADAIFTGLALGPVNAPVVGVQPSWQWNVHGQRITAAGETIPGEIDTCKKLLQSLYNAALTPPGPEPFYTFLDATILVRQLADMTGGAAPMLDGLGADRGVLRAGAEPDDRYRYRVRNLPDTVTPGAVKRMLHTLLDPLHAHFDFEETFMEEYQTCFDYPSANVGTPSYLSTPLPGATPGEPPLRQYQNICCFDDPRPAYGFFGPAYPDSPLHPYPFYNRWMDDVEFRATFVVVVPVLPAIADVGFAFDDTAMNLADLQTTIGQRAYGAFDLPSSFAFGLGGGGFDGFDLSVRAVYRGVYDSMQNIKAAGVTAIEELQGS